MKKLAYVFESKVTHVKATIKHPKILKCNKWLALTYLLNPGRHLTINLKRIKRLFDVKCGNLHSSLNKYTLNINLDTLEYILLQKGI